MLRRLLRWLSGRRSPPADVTSIPAGAVLLGSAGQYDVEVQGRTDDDGLLEAIYLDRPPPSGEAAAECPVIATLVAEQDNSQNAHAVHVTVGGAKVAYLTREVGKRFRRAMGAGTTTVVCRATVRPPGAGEPRFRLVLDLATPIQVVTREARTR